MIQCHTSSCHVRTLRLDLQSGKVPAVCLCFQKDRDNASSCPDIQYLFLFLYTGKSGKKDGIHAKTELLRILYDLIAVALQFIDAFPVVHIRIIFLRQFLIFHLYPPVRIIPLTLLWIIWHYPFCVSDGILILLLYIPVLLFHPRSGQ